MGTVGAVAVDAEGNIACATSTGGMLNKMEGRVGDTACIGETSDVMSYEVKRCGEEVGDRKRGVEK